RSAGSWPTPWISARSTNPVGRALLQSRIAPAVAGSLPRCNATLLRRPDHLPSATQQLAFPHATRLGSRGGGSALPPREEYHNRLTSFSPSARSRSDNGRRRALFRRKREKPRRDGSGPAGLYAYSSTSRAESRALRLRLA